MNSHKDPLALPVIKQEFDDDLICSVEGWSPLTGHTAVNSSLPFSPTTTQSVENRFSPTVTTSNDFTTTSTSTPLPNLIKTFPSVASANKSPNIDGHQDFVKKVERNNKRPFLANRNKIIQNDTTVQNNDNTEMLLNFEFQLKTTKQLKELTEMLTKTINANEKLEKKYVELKMDYFEFKANSKTEVNILKIKNSKLQNELNLMKNHHQTCCKQIINPNMVKVIIPENELLRVEDNLGQDNDKKMSNTGKDNNSDHSVVQSLDTFTNVRSQSNQIVSKLPTSSNLSKRKQSQADRTVKRSKKTIENNAINQIDDKIKVLHLNCTQPKCKAQLNSLKHLQHHLNTAHELLPFQCFAQNCNLRFDNRRQMGAHIKIHQSKETKFLCPICVQESVSQKQTYDHWSRCHLSGKFQCNLNQCNLVLDTRRKVSCHQRYKHSKRRETL